MVETMALTDMSVNFRIIKKKGEGLTC